MSGGHWNYKNNGLAHEIFGWRLSPDYGERGYKQAQEARKVNPLDNREVSEMVWDMFCLLYSYDYYISGDTSEDQYKKDLKYFKNKWLKRTPEDESESMKQDLRDYCEELIKEME